MKTLLEIINEAELSNWGVENVTQYVKRIKNMLVSYGEKEAANKAKVEKRTAKSKFAYTKDIKNLTFKSYPIAIAINKLGYDAESVVNSKGKVDYNYVRYTHWLADQINSEKVSIDDLANWWHDADAAVAKAKWFDYKKIIKDIDPVKVWDPYYPDSNAIIEKIRKNPFAIVYYLKDNSKYDSYTLTYSERDELKSFMADPANVAMVNKLIDKLIPSFENARPTISSAVSKYLEDLFTEYPDNTFNFEGDAFGDYTPSKLFKKKERDAWYAGQSNGNSVLGKSIQTIVVKAFKNMYKSEDELLKAFQSGEHIKVIDLGRAKEEHSDVHNSSFWTEYKHNFKVQIWIYPNTKDIENNKPDYEEEFDNITTYESYYSGGWN